MCNITHELHWIIEDPISRRNLFTKTKERKVTVPTDHILSTRYEEAEMGAAPIEERKDETPTLAQILCAHVRRKRNLCTSSTRHYAQRKRP